MENYETYETQETREAFMRGIAACYRDGGSIANLGPDGVAAWGVKSALKHYGYKHADRPTDLIRVVCLNAWSWMDGWTGIRNTTAYPDYMVPKRWRDATHTPNSFRDSDPWVGWI